MKILIVEDDPVSRKVLHSIVKSVCDNCELAENGEQAFDHFLNASEASSPFDLIFLDVMMPEVNGQETLAAIREFELQEGISRDEGVRVIMTTALDDGQNIYQAHANGCVDYIVKPLSREKILKAIDRLGVGFLQE
jgi:two-component system chemotaxis response regulator CheY